MSTPVYHQDFSDPTADLVIKCKDGVLLRVHSYILKVHSLYFRDMPDHSVELSGASEKIIDLEARSHDFAILLDIISIQPTHRFVNWYQLMDILELGVKFKFLRLPELLRSLMVAAIHDAPWSGFRYASEHGDIDLAKRAIAGMSDLEQFGRSDSGDIRAATFAGISGIYAAALLQAMNTYPYENEMDTKSRWADIAHEFRV